MKRCVSILLFAVLLTLSAGSREADAACAMSYLHPHTVTNDWHGGPPDKIYTRIESTYFWDDHFDQSQYYAFGQVKSHTCGAYEECAAQWTNEVFSDLTWRIGRWRVYVQDRDAIVNMPVSCSVTCSNSGSQRTEEYVHECPII